MSNHVDLTPTVLCIGGLDPCGGAGLTADARACAAFGALCLPIATAIVVQNTRGVKKIEPIAPNIVAAQIETLLEDIQPAAIKIGLIATLSSVEGLASLLRPLHNLAPIVLDTVFAPSTGQAFNDNSTIEAIRGQLLPLATVVTPNALEARQLGTGEISDLNDMARGAIAIHERTGAHNVLMKGGHAGNAQFAIDLFFDGTRFLELRAERENSYEVRGTGCLLASALAAGLAKGKTAPDAATDAKTWLTEQYLSARAIGHGRRIAAI
jgi:hydroxymethylpyrimidine/phosphomethylpyrimidine kinase